MKQNAIMAQKRSLLFFSGKIILIYCIYVAPARALGNIIKIADENNELKLILLEKVSPVGETVPESDEGRESGCLGAVTKKRDNMGTTDSMISV